MDIKLSPQKNCSATFTASIPEQDVSTQHKSIASAYQKHASIPGFRKGKAPASFIAKRYGKEITEELEGKLFDKVCDTLLTENKDLKVLNFGKPEITTEADGSMSITSTITIIPPFDLPDYKSIEVTVASDEVTDEDLDEELKNIAERMADYEPVKRAAKTDDIAVVNFTSTIEGKPLAEAVGAPVGFLEGREGQWMPVKDDQYLPGFGPQLEGTKAGEEKNITVTMPDNYPLEELRNKVVEFAVTVTEVREKVLPSIDDELAAKLMPGKTLEDVKATLKTNLEVKKKRENDSVKADQISEKLAAMLKFELPDFVVEQEAQSVVRNKMQEALYSGQPVGDFEKLMESMQEGAKEEAANNLRVFFALQAIAEKEGISVETQEILSEIARQAQQTKQDPKAYMRKLQREGRVQSIGVSLVTGKTLDFLVKEAKVNL